MSRNIFQILTSLVLFFILFSCEGKKNKQDIQPDHKTNTLTAIKSGTLIDFEGNSYNTVVMCDGKEWMTENLNVSIYRNGDTIPYVEDPEVWSNLTTGAWTYYQNDYQYGKVFGKLYNWYAVNDSRGLAPKGWRVADEEDWREFIDCLGGENVAGGLMKQIGTSHWASPNVGAVNSSGFSALPAGGRSSKGDFSMVESLGIFWSASNYDELQAWIKHVSFSNTFLVSFYNDKKSGFSVRCVRE